MEYEITIYIYNKGGGGLKASWTTEEHFIKKCWVSSNMRAYILVHCYDISILSSTVTAF
jgi:hypothetical protein